jgi:hypothetical protein
MVGMVMFARGMFAASFRFDWFSIDTLCLRSEQWPPLLRQPQYQFSPWLARQRMRNQV